MSILKNKVAIPQKRIQKSNKKQFSQELNFDEDDLGGLGNLKLRIKIKVQKDSIFVSMNSFTETDRLVLSVNDTRYFIDFLDRYSIIRQVDCYEAGLEDLQQKGFKFYGSFQGDLDQVEKVIPFLHKVYSHSELIKFI